MDNREKKRVKIAKPICFSSLTGGGFEGAAVFTRRAAGVFTEEAAEERLVGEIESVRDFSDGESGAAEQPLRHVDECRLNPPIGRFPAFLLDDVGEIAGREAGLRSEERYIVMAGGILFQREQEVTEYNVETVYRTQFRQRIALIE